MPATDSAVASDWLDQTALIPADYEKNDQNMNKYHIMTANTSIPVMEEGRYNQAGLLTMVTPMEHSLNQVGL